MCNFFASFVSSRLLLATSFSWWFNDSTSQTAGFSLLEPALAMLCEGRMAKARTIRLKPAGVCLTLTNHHLKVVASNSKDSLWLSQSEYALAAARTHPRLLTLDFRRLNFPGFILKR